MDYYYIIHFFNFIHKNIMRISMEIWNKYFYVNTGNEVMTVYDNNTYKMRIQNLQGAESDKHAID